MKMAYKTRQPPKDKKHVSLTLYLAMAALTVLLALAAQLLLTAATALNINITALATDIESDWTTVYYPRTKSSPLLIGNDGAPDTGGFHVFALDSSLSETASRRTGRTKLVTVVHGAERDLLVTIAQPDSVVRVFELPGLKRVKDADRKVLGDWSALCTWKSGAGNDYVYLFGKREGMQLLVKKSKKSVEIVEVSGQSRRLWRTY